MSKLRDPRKSEIIGNPLPLSPHCVSSSSHLVSVPSPPPLLLVPAPSSRPSFFLLAFCSPHLFRVSHSPPLSLRSSLLLPDHPFWSGDERPQCWCFLNRGRGPGGGRRRQETATSSEAKSTTRPEACQEVDKIDTRTRTGSTSGSTVSVQLSVWNCFLISVPLKYGS